MTAERPPQKVATTVDLGEFLNNDLGPALAAAMQAAGCVDLDLKINADNVTARWDLRNEQYAFTVYFDEGTPEGRKTLVSSRGGRGEVIEMFMPPERGFTKGDSAIMVELLMVKFSTTKTWLTKPKVAK